MKSQPSTPKSKVKDIDKYQKSSSGTGNSRASLKRKRKSITTSDNSKNILINNFESENHTISSYDQKDELKFNIDIDIKSFSLSDIIALIDVVDIECSQRSATVMSAIVYPVTRKQFYNEFWNQKPLYSSKNCSSWIKKIVSRKKLEQLTECQILIYGETIDISKYQNNNLESFNKYKTTAIDEQVDGKIGDEAKTKDIWNHFNDGCTLTFLQPQQYLDTLWSLIVTFEDEFTTMVESFLHLSKLGYQGKCPLISQCDNIFVQINGSSHFRIYQSKQTNFNSYDSVDGSDFNFIVNHADLPQDTYLDVILYAGDTCYIPHGWVYQYDTEVTSNELHSLLLQIQFNKYNKSQNLVEMLLPQAILATASKDLSPNLNDLLPRDYLNYMGVAYSEIDDSRRDSFQRNLKSLLSEVVKEAIDMADAASDQVTAIIQIMYL